MFTCHLSPITCNMSPITCYLSPVTRGFMRRGHSTDTHHHTPTEIASTRLNWPDSVKMAREGTTNRLISWLIDWISLRTNSVKITYFFIQQEEIINKRKCLIKGRNFRYTYILKILLGGGEVSKGYWSLFGFELLACYHLNLGIFSGIWLFQNFCSPKKWPYLGQV